VHRIDSDASVNGLFSAGDPASGQPGTVVSPEWLNAIQEEIAGLIEAMGGTLAKANNAQLAAVILGLFARLNTWTAHQTFNDAIDVNNRLTVTGSDSINGEANVGVKVRASTAPGSDAPVLLGSRNGNAPFIAAGEDGNGVWHGLDIRTGGLTRIYVESDGDVSVAGKELKDVATPTSADSAANKGYVDALGVVASGRVIGNALVAQSGRVTITEFAVSVDGVYRFTIPGITANAIVVATLVSGAVGYIHTDCNTAGKLTVTTYWFGNLPSPGSASNCNFCFAVLKL